MATGRRVLRGGAFLYFSEVARCADHDNDEPGFRDVSLGFRVVVSPLGLL